MTTSQSIILIAIACFFFGVDRAAQASVGGEVGNGGDANEMKFKSIALNIQQWIVSGNADDLKLPKDMSLDDYKKRMLSSLNNYDIHFTQDKVIVAGAEKTCENFLEANGSGRIICNAKAFSQSWSTSIDDIYRLVHHEFAGLAGFEENRSANSDYSISSQLSAYLQVELIRRLPIAPQKNNTYLRAVTGWRSTDDHSDVPTVSPFALDSNNRVSRDKATAKNKFSSLASVSSDGVKLEFTNNAIRRALSVIADSEVSIEETDSGVKRAITAMEVPPYSAINIPYECTLQETGETLKFAPGVGSGRFRQKSNSSPDLTSVAITTSNDNLYLSQFVGSSDASSAPAFSKAVLRVKRGVIEAQFKFYDLKNGSLSIACVASSTISN